MGDISTAVLGFNKFERYKTQNLGKKNRVGLDLEST